MKSSCEQCGCDFQARGARGRTPRFCSAACKQKAYRERRAPKVMRDARRRAEPKFPDRMTGVARWTRADGKRPIRVDGSPASSTLSASWTSFANVQTGAGDGFGVMLGGGLACFDLDHVIDRGGLKKWAADYVSSIDYPVVFAEVSKSGEGLHVFVEAPEQRGRRLKVPGGEVEFYSRARFIRCTGNALDLPKLVGTSISQG